MFKRISHIKNFGVFRNYRKSGNIQDFKKLNIIYGWNYSGKTTIARLFHCLEEGELHQNYPDCEFEILDQDDNKYSESYLIVPGKQIRVFNSDFIRKNLKWDGEAFDPILLLGEESIEAEKEIEKTHEKISKIEKIVGKLRRIHTNLDYEIENGLTNTARDITTKLGLVESFTKTHLRPIFNKIRENHSEYIIDRAKEAKLLKAATASEDDKLPKLTEYSPRVALKTLIDEVTELVKEVPEFSKIIDYFLNNPKIAQWVELGIPLHENKEICEYCGNMISSERREDLLTHFSEDLKNHKIKLEDLNKRILDSKLQAPVNTKRDFYQALRDDFDATNEKIKESIKEYNKQLDELRKKVQSKKDKPFEQITNLTVATDCSQTVSPYISTYNEIIKKNNENTDKFDENKSTARTNLKNHYTAVFIDEIDLFKKQEKISIYREREQKLERLKQKVEAKILKLEAQISNAQKGGEKLNEYIQSFLGQDEIKVKVHKEGENERFTLKRGTEKAVNLSEGEKTAIAFSFFLTKLMEIEDLKTTIIYIDDPISSLDSNHIFQVNALVRDFFFYKEDENSSWELNCDQVFFSTHNFDFFSLLRNLPRKNRPQNENDLQHSYYFVKRKNRNEAIIEKLPDAILKYTSEYHYLFKEIYEFYKSDDKLNYSVLMNLPNAVRRFVELYTYSRLPGNRSSTVDARANILWGSERSTRVLKVFHYFSHSNNIERMSKYSDLVCDIENAINDLMEELKKDTLHYTELEKSVVN